MADFLFTFVAKSCVLVVAGTTTFVNVAVEATAVMTLTTFPTLTVPETGWVAGKLLTLTDPLTG